MRKLYAECRLLAPLAAVQEQMATERICADDLLCLGRKAVKSVAKINRAAGEKYLRARRQADHSVPFTARNTRDSAFSLTEPLTRSRTPFGNAISI